MDELLKVVYDKSTGVVMGMVSGLSPEGQMQNPIAAIKASYIPILQALKMSIPPNLTIQN